jgi:antitoxin component YwqK of YwqJK toxin-antitoxin module
MLSGFSNHGGTVFGRIRDTTLNIHRQRSHIIPFGGRGKVEWFIHVDAHGTVTDSAATFRFYFRKDGEPEHRGKLWATRITKEKGRYIMKDTAIGSKYYSWRYYDEHQRLKEVGQRFDGQVKNGQWLFFDYAGVLLSEVIFRNDTLHGWGIEYNDSGSELTEDQGMYLGGKKVGKWVEKGKTTSEEWVIKFVRLFDIDGNLVTETTFVNGKRNMETFYDKDEKPVWYRYFQKNGKLSSEGPNERVIIEGKY